MNEQQLQEQLGGFRRLVRRMKHVSESVELMAWDLRTGAPRKGVEGRSEAIGELSTQVFKMSVSDEMGAYLQALGDPAAQEKLGRIDRRMAEECRREYERSKKIPADKYQQYVVLTSQAESVWEDAKHASDFAAFRPYLEKIVRFKQEFLEYWGYGDNKYDTLLDLYEPEMTVRELDAVFQAVKEKTVPLAARIRHAADRPDSAFLYKSYEKAKQRQFSEYILGQMGYDFAAGRLDESVHPFATGLNPGDVRITTSFKPNDLTFALFGTIHEGGHALYEQNIGKDLWGTILCGGASMGIHESQSRFWENFIGLSLPFWKRYFAELADIFPHELAGQSAESFYRAVNEVEPGLIRIEADELTYNLHIMVRYELEKALINGEIRVAELPEAWNAKYGEYLGVTPDSDATGVLQDVHWSGGEFGYFPSYALGNMYAAQIMDALKREMPDLDGALERGELLPVKDWLTEKIYRCGMLLKPAEIIREVTGGPLNPNVLTDYLERKFTAIYRL